MSKTHDNYQNILRSVLIGFFFSSCLNFIYPLFVLLLVDAGLNRTQAALIQSAGFLASVLLLPKTGKFLDQGKIGRLIVWSLIGTSVGTFCFFVPFSSQYLWLQFLIGAAFFMSASAIRMTITKRLTEGLASKSKLAKAAATTYFVENFAVTFSAFLGYLFIDKYKFYLLSLDLVGTGIFLLLLYRTTLLSIKDISLAKADSKVNVKIAVKLSPQIYVQLIAIALILTTVLCHISAIPLLFSANGFEAKSTTSLMLGVNTITVLLVTLALSKWNTGYSNQSLFVFGSILTFIGHVIMPFMLTTEAVIGATIVWSVAEGLIYPSMSAILLSHFTKEESGRAVSIKTMTWRLSLAIAPLLASAIQSLPTYSFSFVFGALPIFGLGLFFFSRSEKFLEEVVVV